MSSSIRNGWSSSTHGSGVGSARPKEEMEPSLRLPPLRFMSTPHQPTGFVEAEARRNIHLPSVGLPPIAHYVPQLPELRQHPHSKAETAVRQDPRERDSATAESLPTCPSHLPLAPSDSHRGSNGGKTKKEIKRRTRTGCRTCRTRRIKVGMRIL